MKELEREVRRLSIEYNMYYKTEFIESSKILEYWENEFFWWKREAFEEVLELIEKSKNNKNIL